MRRPIDPWLATDKTVGLACFLTRLPVDAHGNGDAQEFFRDIPSAVEWADKAVLAGRFKLIRLWVFKDKWEASMDFKAD